MSVFNKIISFFCGDNIDKIRIRESTVMRNNQVHKLHKEIIDQLGDLATVVSFIYLICTSKSIITSIRFSKIL